MIKSKDILDNFNSLTKQMKKKIIMHGATIAISNLKSTVKKRNEV